MENVPEVIGSANIADFQKWEHRLEEFGYKNYVEILNAKNYGIPQNRKRCFMVSILGNYAYNFPIKFKRAYRLKDLLEAKVNDKYFLSRKLANCFLSNGTDKYCRKDIFLSNINRKNQDIANTVTTLAGNRPTDNFVLEKYGNKALDETLRKHKVKDGDIIDAYNRSVKKDVANTTTTRVSSANETFIVDGNKPSAIPIKNNTKQGYLLAEDGDGIDISGRMASHRGTVQKGLAQTLKTNLDVGVVVKDGKE